MNSCIPKENIIIASCNIFFPHPLRAQLKTFKFDRLQNFSPAPTAMTRTIFLPAEFFSVISNARNPFCRASYQLKPAGGDPDVARRAHPYLSVHEWVHKSQSVSQVSRRHSPRAWRTLTFTLIVSIIPTFVLIMSIIPNFILIISITPNEFVTLGSNGNETTRWTARVTCHVNSFRKSLVFGGPAT